MKRQSFWGAAIFFLLGLTTHLSFYDFAIAQQQSGGVVTGLQGQAQLTRPAVAPTSLKFKDNVIIRDVVDTREKSLARILFGGRSTVTVRELSRLEVREELLPTGARRDVHDLSSGAILVNVARQLMRPGDEVVIRTPNAVATIRGSTTFAAFNALLNHSFFAQISGDGVLSILGQPTFKLVANTPNNGANVTGSGPNVQVNIIAVPPAQANQILSESQVGKVVKEEGNKGGVVAAAVKEAAALANAVIETFTKTDQTTTGESKQGEGTKESKSDSTTTAPVTADTSSASSSENLVKNPGFETTGSIPEWNLTGAGAIITSVKNSSSGSAVFSPTEKSHMAIIHTGTGASSNTTSTLSQTSNQIKQNKTYLITFDYLFMSNEFPIQSTTFNDTFTAKGISLGSGGGDVTIVTESRNSSTFKTDKPTIISNGSTDTSFSNFTLTSGNGYVDCAGSCANDDSGNATKFKTASKTVQPDTTSGTLEFKIIDVGDTSVDSAVLIDNVVVKLAPPLYEVFNGQSLTGPSGKPLVEFSNETTTFDSVLVSSGSGPGSPAISLSGPVLKAENSDLTVPFSLLGLLDGRELISSSSDGLVSLNGGSYALSTELGTAIFDFWGSKTAIDPETGVAVGSGKTVTHAGPLLEASGGATVDTQKVLKLDTALLEATAPIIRLIGTPNAQTSLTTQQSTIDLIKAKVTSTGPVVAMDKSFINVTNGALINLTHGSNMKVTGDLISMLSGSKINVVNGPLISAAGAGSLLDVSGALVNFGGTGGNKIVVNNSIAPTATLSGLPVSATYGGSVNIGANPIKNPSLGSISVNGSLISATNGGKVDIKGQ